MNIEINNEMAMFKYFVVEKSDTLKLRQHKDFIYDRNYYNANDDYVQFYLLFYDSVEQHYYLSCILNIILVQFGI